MLREVQIPFDTSQLQQLGINTQIYLKNCILKYKQIL